MNTLAGLIRAVLESPHDETRIGALADYLQENGDGRGDIVRKWLNQTPKQRRDEYHYLPWDWGDPADRRRHYQSPADVSTHTGDPGVVAPASIGRRGLDVPRPDDDLYAVFTLRRHDPHAMKQFPVRVSHEEARDIADRLPDRDTAHEFLDRHAGPDPRLAHDLNHIHGE